MKISVIAQKVPIFVMSYNDMLSLRLCLRALVRRTMYAHSIIVVDNGSSDKGLLRYLKRLAGLTKIVVHLNLLNLWVLGVNKAVTDWSKASGNDDRFVLTDCDIIPPPPVDGQCWLTRMQALMDCHACVGKLGLSLDLGYIKTREKFRHTYEREKFFMQGPRIGEMVIAPVDTTLALYRKSMFVSSRPWFIPTHQGLYRPYYYCCRTPQNFQAKHLSWRFYDMRTETDVVAKLRCFGIVGATVVPAVYNVAPFHAKLFYTCVRPFARFFWGTVVVVLQANYLLRSFPRRVNALQASRRA
jgi:glycosyltransferase involved in cell wall biosynthesis